MYHVEDDLRYARNCLKKESFFVYFFLFFFFFQSSSNVWNFMYC